MPLSFIYIRLWVSQVVKGIMSLWHLCRLFSILSMPSVDRLLVHRPSPRSRLASCYILMARYDVPIPLILADPICYLSILRSYRFPGELAASSLPSRKRGHDTPDRTDYASDAITRIGLKIVVVYYIITFLFSRRSSSVTENRVDPTLFPCLRDKSLNTYFSRYVIYSPL